MTTHLPDDDGEWNVSNFEAYTYNDHTGSRYFGKAFGAWYEEGPGFDRLAYCPECRDPLLVREDTRNPAHEIEHLCRVASRMRVPGVLVLWSGTRPKSLYLVQWGESDEGTWRRYMDEVLDNPGRQPTAMVLAKGSAQVTLRYGQVILEHLVSEHPTSRHTHDCARQLGFQRDDPA